jgi:hypothetical protein
MMGAVNKTEQETEKARKLVSELETRLVTLLPGRDRKAIIKRCHELVKQGLLADQQREVLPTFFEQLRKHRRKWVRSLNKVPMREDERARLIEQCPPDVELKRPKHRPKELIRKFEEAVQQLLTVNGIHPPLAAKYTAALLQLYNRRLARVDHEEVTQRLNVRRSQAKKPRSG